MQSGVEVAVSLGWSDDAVPLQHAHPVVFLNNRVLTGNLLSSDPAVDEPA
jgi:hypothetical protein